MQVQQHLPTVDGQEHNLALECLLFPMLAATYMWLVKSVTSSHKSTEIHNISHLKGQSNLRKYFLNM